LLATTNQNDDDDDDDDADNYVTNDVAYADARTSSTRCRA